MTLVILAAGMGSRYGGLKQIDPITDQGDFIIDFSVFDAIRAGFNKVVFVIKEENLDVFRATVGKRFEDRIAVEYVFQDLQDIPDGCYVPEGRQKPWGTAHALLAARHVVKEPFAVINADDFYGHGAYRMLFDHFRTPKAGEYCMIGYILKQTLTENGTVSRGVCEIGEDGYLVDVVERTAIARRADGAAYTENGVEVPLSPDSVVSMNCWGFTPDIFAGVEEGFRAFFAEQVDQNPLKCEYYLPFAVRELMEQGKCAVKVYASDSPWYGVTYHEDKEAIKQSLTKLKQDGTYPSVLSEK